MNTNAYSIRTPLKLRYCFEGCRQCRWTNCNPPVANPVLFLSVFVLCEGEEEKRCYAYHPSGLETNESVFFLASAPEMRRSVIEGQVSTYVSLCDREITLRWQKASATSITCTLLPAILRSLKAILKCFRKGNFSLPQWSEVLSRWLVKDIYLCCDSWPKIAPILLLFLLLSFYFSPISLCPAIHVFMFSLCASSVMNFSRVLNSQLFASWHNMKGRTTAADRDASFIFINQTTVECSRMEGEAGRGRGMKGGSDTCRKKLDQADFLSLQNTLSHTHMHKYSNCLIFLCHASLFEIA